MFSMCTLPDCWDPVLCANAGTGMSARQMPSVMLAVMAPAPRATCQTLDSCGSSSGHMHSRLPQIRIRQPNQIHPTSGFRWIWSEATLVSGLMLPTTR